MSAGIDEPTNTGCFRAGVLHHRDRRFRHRFYDPTLARVAAIALLLDAHMLAVRHRDYAAEYSARKERRRPGTTVREALGHRTAPHRVATKSAGQLRPSERAARNRALDTLARMRRDGLSLNRAAREAGTTPDAVRRYAGPALERHGSRWKATGSDRLLRRQWTTILGTDGGPAEAIVETASSRQASEIGEHNSDIAIFLSASTSIGARDGARKRLRQRHGRRAGRRAFLASGTVLDNPAFYGRPDGLEALAVEIDLGDLDYGSDAPTRFSR